MRWREHGVRKKELKKQYKSDIKRIVREPFLLQNPNTAKVNSVGFSSPLDCEHQT